MMVVEKKSLEAWHVTLSTEISELEMQLEKTRRVLEAKREQLRAIEVLIGPSTTSENLVEDDSLRRVRDFDTGPEADVRHDPGLITPASDYWVPILESLEERGGRERSDIILEMVLRKMDHILTAADHEVLPSGISPRWRNRAQWQRQNMVQRGFMSKNSPHGIWEITRAGRDWLSRAKEKPTDRSPDGKDEYPPAKPNTN